MQKPFNAKQIHILNVAEELIAQLDHSLQRTFTLAVLPEHLQERQYQPLLQEHFYHWLLSKFQHVAGIYERFGICERCYVRRTHTKVDV